MSCSCVQPLVNQSRTAAQLHPPAFPNPQGLAGTSMYTIGLSGLLPFVNRYMSWFELI